MTQRLLLSLGASALVLAIVDARPADAQATQPPPANVAQSSRTPDAVEQQTTPPSAEPEGGAESAGTQGGDIVVTGTRTGRSGYNAPTPTTVLGIEQIQQTAPATIADYVNQQPALAGSLSPRNNNGTTTGGIAGANLLNLRGLGVNRTLVLLDGRRVAPSTLTGAVDVNVLPSAAVKRVDIVTGGASAAYGSDAVAGVVNFVLDDTYTGLKGEVSRGITDQGDGSSTRAELTGGLAFAGGRAHLLVSGSYTDTGRVLAGDRSWYNGSKFIPNPAYTATNGAAQYIVSPGVGLASATDNGLITAGALRGTQFGANGLASATPFAFGYTSGLESLGGTAEDQGGRIEIAIPTRNYSIFSHGQFDLTDHVQLYGEVSYARSEADYLSVSYNRFGNLTISANNAYLDPAIKARLTAAGATSFSFGTSNYKFGQVRGYNQRELTRFLGGAKGDLGKFRWDVYYQRGESRILTQAANNPIVANYNKAVNAVTNASGNIVCAVNATVSAANDAACVPFNVFGSVAPSDAARAYAFGTASQAIALNQDVASGSISGEPFSTWAGPVSVVGGGEYRHETFNATADAISQASGFFTGNYKASSGQLSVREGFGEVIVPLLHDVRFFKDVSFNGAVRYTDYSVSGGVTTWKAGLTWDVSDELRFRGTRSRDIRAPNLNELFQGGQASTLAITDPVTNSSYTTQVFIVGNKNLVPEKADTLTLGAVLKPHLLSGLSLSVDYYNIKINNAIVTLNAQNLINGCQAGSTQLCGFITRDATSRLITQILTPGINFSREKASGLDIEASYGTGLGAGRLNLSLLANHVFKRDVDTGFIYYSYADTLVDNTAVPSWRSTFTINYALSGTSLNVRERFIGAGRYTNLFTVADNHVRAAYYTDLTLTHAFDRSPGRPTLFFSVENLLDQDPPVSPVTTPIHINTGVNGSVYDVLGRAYRAGFRFAF